ncbi:MAG: CocE/NonD family hydrolase, partial [Planctomycetota bacterium]
AILFMSPYYGRLSLGGDSYLWNMRHELGDPPEGRREMPRRVARIKRPVISTRYLNTWVPRGYAVVHASAPGTGLSQGCPTVGGQNEYDAPKAVVDWLCGRAKGYTTPTGGEPVTAEWCTGAVAMSGTSYNGTFALAGALTGVEGLKLVIPVAPNTSYYHYYRSNGLVRHPYGYLGEEIDVLGEAILIGSDATRKTCEAVQKRLFVEENIERETGDWNEFWLGRDMLPRMDQCRAAILMAHAFNDWNVVPEHSIRIYERAKELGIPAGIYLHQGGHGGPPPTDVMNTWLTHFLHGIENDWDEGGRAWIVREKAARDKPTRYADYPNPEAAPVRLTLSPAAPQIGRLMIEEPAKSSRPDHSEATATPGGTEITETFEDNFSFGGAELAQAEWTDHRLLYVTPTLKTPVHLSGTPEISVTLSCDRPAANLSVWLVSLPWNESPRASILDNVITRGWADPQNHADWEGVGEPLEPGKKYTMTFPLQPDDQIIPAGQQIGLLIFSSDDEFTTLPDPGTKITVYTERTKLTLPVVGGADLWTKATAEEEQASPAASR